jgi:hypothetical protein
MEITDKPFQWTDKQQKAFEATKTLISVDALLRYHDQNKLIDIENDASNY